MEGPCFCLSPPQMQGLIWIFCKCLCLSEEDPGLAVGATKLLDGRGSFTLLRGWEGVWGEVLLLGRGLACWDAWEPNWEPQTPPGSNILSVTPAQVWEEGIPTDLGREWVSWNHRQGQRKAGDWAGGNKSLTSWSHPCLSWVLGKYFPVGPSLPLCKPQSDSSLLNTQENYICQASNCKEHIVLSRP